MGKKLKLTNGVSFGGKYTVTSADETAGEIEFDLCSEQTDNAVGYDVVAAFTVLSSANVNVALADAVITYPSDGVVKLANGAVTFVLTAGQIITVVAQRSVEIA